MQKDFLEEENLPETEKQSDQSSCSTKGVAAHFLQSCIYAPFLYLSNNTGDKTPRAVTLTCKHQQTEHKIELLFSQNFIHAKNRLPVPSQLTEFYQEMKDEHLASKRIRGNKTFWNFALML